jgi:hypothetical protein
VLPFLLMAALVLLMVFCVVATLVVENWSRPVVRLPSAPAEPSVAPARAAPVESAPSATVPEDLRLEVPGRAAADRLVAVLFASYAARREPEANRVAAWVTASEWPPSGFGGAYRPGADLRGRPAAVARLLECADEGRCWLTLNTDVDIERGLRTRPPSCDLLGSVLLAFRASRTAMTRLDAEQVRDLAAALRHLEPTWSPSTGAADVAPLAEAVERASALGTGLCVSVPLVPPGTAGPDGSAGPVGSAGSDGSESASQPHDRELRRVR